MKKKIISLALTISLAVGLGIFSAGVTANSASGSRYILDMSSEEAFSATKGAFYKHNPTEAEPDPLLGGKYSWSADEHALKIEYSPCAKQQNYRLMTKFATRNVIPESCKYFVLVYKAETTEDYRISLFNSPKAGVEAVIQDKGGDTGGEWVISKPVDISTVGGHKTSIFGRWRNDNNINTLNIASEDENMKFYVKQYGFFDSPEAAEKYYASVDFDSTEPKVEYPAPALMRFGNSVNMGTTKTKFFTTADKITEGVYQNTKYNDTPCIKLLAEHTKSSSSITPFRMMIQFSEKDMITADHKYVRVTYHVEDDIHGSIELFNNATRANAMVVPNTSPSQNGWALSEAVDISGIGILPRLKNGQHFTLMYRDLQGEAEVYIKEIAFFTSLEQAYSYYGETVPESTKSNVSSLTFGKLGSTAFFEGAEYGVYTNNNTDNTLDITYAEKVNFDGNNYMAKIKFSSAADYNGGKYMRVLYAAENPDSTASVDMLMRRDGSSETLVLKKDVQNTDGEFVLTDTVMLPDTFVQRYSDRMHTTLMFNSTVSGGEYRIKGVYFFTDKDAADGFVISGGDAVMTVNGIGIAKYSIVVDDAAPKVVNQAARSLQQKIFSMTNIMIPIVTDITPEGEYEIIVGHSSREASYRRLNELQAIEYQNQRISYHLDGSKVVFASVIPSGTMTAVETFINSYLLNVNFEAYEFAAFKEFTVDDTSDFRKYNWGTVTNVDDPTVFTEDFASDDGYFTEIDNGKNWVIGDGRMSVSAADETLSLLHVYETNVKATADITFASKANGKAGIALRWCAADCYVKAGYDFTRGGWFIDSREGYEFYLRNNAFKAASVEAGRTYKLEFTVDGGNASLKVDGETVLTANGIETVTPGRIGLFAQNADISADNFEAVLLSGQGSIMKNVIHNHPLKYSTKVGVSFVEPGDGTVRYMLPGVGFTSNDNGYTWEPDKLFTDTNTQFHDVYRLNDGSILKIGTRTTDGKRYIVALRSVGGGEFTEVGTICAGTYPGTAGNANNMNDKLFQSPTTNRIFFVQNYDDSTKTLNGAQVFTVVYYSDDNGKTWTESETGSWEIEGNEGTVFFGESKVLECADGTLRMYNSWNTFGCIVYSESADNGKTWGPLVKMPEFRCATTSMEFARDAYADNDHTYYMVWVYDEDRTDTDKTMPRSRLALAKTTDGKSWVYIGDVWRWESGYRYYNGAFVNHLVNPSVYVTEDTVIAASGYSDYIDGMPGFHGDQQQHVWTFDKASLPEGKVLNTFTDVEVNAPYFEAVNFVVTNGLFNGTSETTFSPDTVMNRAMFVTVLGRLDGADTSAYATPAFSDVKHGEWYTEYVGWASANGIVNGLGGGIYGINNDVTVEQAMTILYRYNGGKTTDKVVGGKMTDFADSASVSDWAADAVKWAVENGIYSGYMGNLNPKSAASRGEVATVFANYVKAFG